MGKNPISLSFSTQELLGLILNVNNFDGYGSEVWEILAGCGWLWVVVTGCGSLWVVVGHRGWFWLVPHFSMYGQSTESTITLSCPSQKYWCSSEGETMSQERLMPIHNEKVESASQTDQDIIVLGSEEYQNLLHSKKYQNFPIVFGWKFEGNG